MKAIPILAFVVTALIGWNLGGTSAPASKLAPGPAADNSERTRRPAREARKVRGPEGEAGQRLASIRASGDPAARMRATVELASSISPADFAAWMDGGWFNISGGAELTLFTKIIEERWRLEDPEGLVVWALKNRPSLASVTLASWAGTDPQRLLDFYKAHPDDRSEMQSLVKIADKNPAMALQRMRELLGGGGVREREFSAASVLAAIAEKSPATLEGALDELPVKMKLQAEIALFSARMKDAPGEEMKKLREHPDGGSILKGVLSNRSPDERAAIQAEIFANLADLPASWRAAITSSSYQFIGDKVAAQWITADLESAGFSETQAKNLRSQALNSLYNQPETAIKFMAQVEMDEDNRKNFISNMFGNLRGKPEKVAALAAQLPTAEDREFALAMAAPRDEQKQAKLDNPTDWLASLATVDPKDRSSSTYSYISATREWDAAKRAEVVRQFNALPEDAKRTVSQTIVRDGYSDPNPLEGDAVRYLVSNPAPAAEGEEGNSSNSSNTPENNNIRLASGYIRKLAQTDPTTAGDWVRSLPDGTAKYWAAKNLQSLWSQYDPASADEWMKTLPATTREQIKEITKKSGN